jgi:N-acetylmuramate 1-kinase
MMTAVTDLIAFARDALGLSLSVPVESSPLGRRGSDRVYYRLRWGKENSAILVDYDPGRVENAYFVDIAIFLESIYVPVPHLIRHDPKNCCILMEDLGDTDLWSLRGDPWETRKGRYRETLVIVHRLHTFPSDSFATRDVRLMEPFGPNLYRWERNYFLEHFVRGLCALKLRPSLREALDGELADLAEGLSAWPSCLVHRDLQSQNVMIRAGNPILIDFQGMRFGNPFYDLGSLLCDPYVDFSPAERDELLAHYYGLTEGTASWPAFQNRFHEASAQRLMQALGAYGFLGVKKGLSAYLRHVPAGLRNLIAAAKEACSLPLLEELCRKCGSALEKSRVIAPSFATNEPATALREVDPQRTRE